MTPRLILHIGTHKTATSTLQALMAANRAALRAAGFLYGRTDRPPLVGRRKHAFLTRQLPGTGASLAALLDALAQELAESGCHTLVLSAEGLSGPRHRPSPEALAGLARRFEVTVVCMLRRQDQFAESAWNQRCKAGIETEDIARFVARPKVRAHMDYLSMLDHWAEAGRVLPIGFEEARAAGVAETFAATTGLPLPSAGADRNVSPSMACAAVMAGFNHLGIGHDWQRIEAWLATNATAPLPRRALGARLRARLMASFAEDNERLAQRYGVVFPDAMPDEDAEPLPIPPRPALMALARELAAMSRPVRRA